MNLAAFAAKFCVAFSVPPFFAPPPLMCSNPWRNNFVEGKNLKLPLKNDTKTTKIRGWAHLVMMVQAAPALGNHLFLLKLQTTCKPSRIEKSQSGCPRTGQFPLF